jgi:hypothetical protein
MTLFFGLFSVFCLQNQPSESGKLGYIRGMGFWISLTGAIIKAVAIGAIRNMCMRWDYYFGCEEYYPHWVWIVVFVTGLIFFIAGLFMSRYARRKFAELLKNRAAPV